MNWLLDHWQPKHTATKVICYVLRVIRLLIALAFLVIPWLWNIQETFDIFKWLWIGLAVIMVDTFILPDKKMQEKKLICPQFTAFTIFLSVYLLCYWHILSLAIIICGNIIVCVLETAFQIGKYKTVKIFTKQNTKVFPKNAIHLVWVSAFYMIAVTLFVLGIIESRTMTFIFGGIADLMLIVSIVLTISKGGLEKKNTFGIILFLIDVLSAVALMTYLIYLIAPEGNNGLQTIILTMVAAIIGGLLTLSGVAWTIRHAEKEKRMEKMAEAKPIFSFNIFMEANPKVHDRKVCWVDDLGVGLDSFAEFENSNKSPFYIKRFYYDKQWHTPSANNMLIQNSRVLVSLKRTDLIEHPIMEVEDLFQQKYYYDLMFVQMPNAVYPNGMPRAYTLCELKGISLEEVEKRIADTKQTEHKEEPHA